VPNHYVTDPAGAVCAGEEVEEPSFERNHTVVKAGLDEPPPALYPHPDEAAGHHPQAASGEGGRSEGLVYRTFGRWLPWRRVFNEYDFWEGYRNRPLIPPERNRHVAVAGNRRARVWARWCLQEGSDGSLDGLALCFEAGPGGLRVDARFPSGTFGPYSDYVSGAMRDVIGPCGRHLDGRPLALAPLADDSLATVSMESGPWTISNCEVRSAGGVAMLCQRWCVARVEYSVIGGMGGACDLAWTRLVPDFRR